jgi:bifunctional non-homologous end joining protein LigD
MPAQSLRTYRRKRDFRQTPEPDGDHLALAAGKGADPRFVIQEHHARNLHWDFRLERDGVLVSWAVPKGLPLDSTENRLAVRTEDHPLEYLAFQGEIPEGSYGAGDVSIWDEGTYEVHRFDDERVDVTLHGSRISGRYVLFPTDDRNWLVHRKGPPLDPDAEPLPKGLRPMLARPGPMPHGPEWTYEIKWDGIRALAYCEGGRVHLESRNGLDISAAYPEVRALGRTLGARTAVLDGEIVAFDEDGRPSFERLQSRSGLRDEPAVRRARRTTPVVYAIFDLLFLDGHSTMRRPLAERRPLLEGLGLSGPAWRVPAAHVDGDALLDAARGRALEGVVAKRLDSLYEPGLRTGAWIKVRLHNRQELVIGGWTEGEGARRGRIGALLVGYYDDGELHYAGRVGTGFTEAMLDELSKELAGLARDTSPFTHGSPPRAAHFVDPALVAEVEFTEWTRAGTLRHPSYKGLRRDVDPRDVVREAQPRPEGQ